MRQSPTVLVGALAALIIVATGATLWISSAKRGGQPPVLSPVEGPALSPVEGVSKPAQAAARAETPRFEEVAQKSGAAFSHARAQFDPKAKPLMPWLTAGGAGVAVADFDRDGLDDFYVVTSLKDAPNALFHNKGNFQFENVAAKLGLADVNKEATGTSAHAVWFDYDGDGWLDLLLLRFGQLSLYRNVEGRAFEDKAKESGLARLLNSMAAVAFDYDRDGDLDLYIGGYFPEKDFNHLPDTKVLFDSWETSRNGGPNYLFRNNGNGTFTDVTAAAGVEDMGWSMAVGHGDLDNDGWQDLYVANDFGPDTVFRNLGNGKFADVTQSTIGVDTKKGMNAEIADYNNDGFLDVYVTNMTEPYLHECNMLWENHGGFKFSDVATETGSCDTGWGWGAKFFDADNDGLQDLYVANGFITDGPEDYMHKLLDFVFQEGIDLRDATKWPDMAGYSMAGRERNFFLHQKFGSFVSEGAAAGVDDPGDSRGVAIADFDRDGRVDFIVTNVAGPMRLFHNMSESGGHWVGFVLKQGTANPDAVGARIVLETDTEKMLREVAVGNGFNSQSMLGAHFGLGRADKIAKLTVTWPDGSSEAIAPPAPGAWYVLERGKGVRALPFDTSGASASPAADTKGQGFVDVAKEAGVSAPHVPAVFDAKLGHIMEMIAAGAAGAAVGDYDRDGDMDIFVNNAKSGAPNHLWRNEACTEPCRSACTEPCRRSGMRFVDVAKAAGVADLNTSNSTSAGGIFVDYDGDGWKDLFVFQMGVSRLMRNRGDGTFEDVTEKAGISGIYRNTLSAIAFDADRDGDVDLYLGAYFPDRSMFALQDDKVMHDSWEVSRNGGSNVYLRNNGDGTFTDATTASGLADTGWTMAVGHGDIDNDGWQDVYVANDYGSDTLFLNNRDGTFKNVTRDALGLDTKKGMNAEFGDIDGDGFLDIYVTNVTEQFLRECNMLWRNNGKGSFTDISQEMAVCDAGWAWGAKFFDLENDGDLDLYVANGFFKGDKGDYLDVLLPALWNNEGENPSSAAKWPPLMGRGIAAKERNVLFLNESGTGFKRVQEGPLAIPSESRGVFTGDFDNDGRIDLFVTNNDAPPFLFHNRTASDNAWLELDLVGHAPNTDAVGARATIITPQGPLVREVNIGNGFAGGSSTRLHFGLGKLRKVDEVKIQWPNGETSSLAAPELNRIIRVEQPAPRKTMASGNAAFRDVTESAGFDFLHHGPVVDEKLHNLGPWFTALGAGGSVGDVNQDGLLDIYLTNSLRGVPNALFLNKGGMKFEEVAARYGVADVNQSPNFSMMSLFADLDQDGLDDLIVVRFGKSVIYRNIKGERFEPVEGALDGAPFPRNPVAVVAIDYDKDGDLDLYFGSYFPDVDLTNVGKRTNLLHDSWEAARNGGTNFLLENQGHFHFVDRTKAAGLEETGWTLAIGTGDIDKDGWTDLYVANDFGADKVYHNNGNGSFTDVSLTAIGVDTKKGMNAELGDFDNDGFLDVYVTNITEPYLHECNMLWRNNGDGSFSDLSTALGTCDTRWGWGAKFIDYDNDGYQDIYVQNGFISGSKKDYIDILMPIMLDSEVNLSDTMNWPPLGEMSFSGYEKKVLFHNVGGNSFEEVGAANGVANDRDGRGLIVADLDNDGDLDMVALNANQKALMYENVYPKPGAKISIELEGKKSNRAGLGTRVTAYTPNGLYYRETNAGNGFQSQSTPLVHIGLGAAKKVDDLEVVWLSGQKQTFHDVDVNQRYFLREGEPLIPWAQRKAGTSPATERQSAAPAGGKTSAHPAPRKAKSSVAGAKAKAQ
ncbi:MAG: FG-GAP-like repeat-containing protein [Methylococcaceae bacterium]|nr:FG-GAP-like repeat-containing protein [Methylococcaceae bacterium]